MNLQLPDNKYLMAILLAALSIILYLQIIHTDFILYDDPTYLNAVRANSKGFWHTVVWSFSSVVNNNWSPITILSLCLDNEFYDFNSQGYHFTNIVIHALNSGLVYLVVLAIFKDRLMAFLVVLIFMAHPLNVEAVSWISERKGILGTFFAYLSILAYLLYRDSHRKIYYILAFLAFSASLMSKAVFVVLPLLFILIDWYRSINVKNFSLRNSIKVSLPFFFVSFVVGLITIYVQEKTGAIAPSALNPFTMRISNGINSYIVYIKQFFYPVNLLVDYRYVPISLPVTIANVTLIILFFHFAIKNRKKRPYILFGLLWYTISLLPVSGIIQSGYHAHADRYTYVAMIGVSVICVMFARELMARFQTKKLMSATIVSIVLATMVFMTLIQQKYWFNTLTLFNHVYVADPENSIALTNIADIYILNNNLKEGMKFYKKASQSSPHYMRMYETTINDLLNVSQYDLAVEVAKDYLKNNQNNIRAHLRIVRLYIDLHKYELAIKNAKYAITSGFKSYQLDYLLALAYHLNKQDDKARAVLLTKPEDSRSTTLTSQLEDKIESEH